MGRSLCVVVGGRAPEEVEVAGEGEEEAEEEGEEEATGRLSARPL